MQGRSAATCACCCTCPRSVTAASTPRRLQCAYCDYCARCRTLQGYGLKGSIPSPGGWDLPDTLTELWFRTNILTGKSSYGLSTHMLAWLLQCIAQLAGCALTSLRHTPLSR